MTDHADSSTESADDKPGRWSTIGWVVTALLLATTLGLIGYNLLTSDTGQGGSSFAKQVGKGERPAAPAMPTVMLLDDADPAALPTPRDDGTYAGPVVLNFWASWCGPCRDETPMFVELSNEYGADGVTFVGANNNDTESKAIKFVEEYEVTYPIVVADDGDLSDWGVSGQPETFVIGTDGNIGAYIPGPVDEATMRQALEAELARDAT